MAVSFKLERSRECWCLRRTHQGPLHTHPTAPPPRPRCRCPAFKLLTYYGSVKERAAKRQGWSKPNAFHVCITSYTLVLQVGGGSGGCWKKG